jgi:hypothetical protein
MPLDTLQQRTPQKTEKTTVLDAFGRKIRATIIMALDLTADFVL